jgi:general stress protein YciG
MANIRSDGNPPSGPSLRGFASMDADKQREIARKGGKSVPAEKRSFSRDPQLAAEAGKKGGNSVPGDLRSFSRNRVLAATAGRKGGMGSRGSRKKASEITENEEAVQEQIRHADEIERLKLN